MKAIILAGGSGTRLGKYTENLPKCMLDFMGKSLIQRQVDVLRKCGIKDIVVVRGFKPEKIDLPNIRYYLNEDYANTNMVETLFKAEAEMDEDILVCYSDIIYEINVLKKIISSNADIGVTVDKDYWEYWSARLKNPEEDTESLVIESGRIVELGDRECSLDKALFRYVGLIKFTKNGISALRKVYHENKEKYFNTDRPWMKSKSFKKAYMTCMLQALINSGYKVEPVEISRGWLEFDTEEDYENYHRWFKEGTLKRFFDFNNL